MCNNLVPLLVLVLIPLMVLTNGAGLFDRPAVRAALIALSIGMLTLAPPRDGLDTASLDRIRLLLGGSLALFLTLRHLRVRWWADARHWRLVLALTALASVLVHGNFGAYEFRHDHDIAHYYLGSKYFAELGYGNLYVALLRAEAMDTGALSAREARDLSTNRMVDARSVLERGGEIERRFTPQRWIEFQTDSRYFRERMGPRYGVLLADHGFNPTPFWVLIGGFIANRVPAGSELGIALLRALDPLLQGITLAAIVWAFGIDVMLLCISYYCLLFGTSFVFIGGAYLRYLSLSCILCAACFLHRRRHAAAGALLALASLLRIFPTFFLAGVALKTGTDLLRRRRPSPEDTRFLAGAIAVGGAGFAATLALARGLGAWSDFFANSAVHMESLSTNFVGLTNLITYARVFDVTAPDGLQRLFEFRRSVYAAQVVVLLPLAALIVAGLSRRVDDLSAAAAGSWLILAGLNLAHYYYGFFTIFVLAFAEQPGKLALLFAAESVMYYLALFEEHAVVLYLYQSLVFLYVLIALYWRPLRTLLPTGVAPIPPEAGDAPCSPR